MSSRPILSPYSVITNASMATSLTSIVTVIQNLSMVSYEVVWSAGSTPVGTISVQVSNDYSQYADGSANNPGNWSDLPLSTTPGITGNTGVGYIDIDANAGYALRLVYTRTSGSGTLNVIVSGKVA